MPEAKTGLAALALEYLGCLGVWDPSPNAWLQIRIRGGGELASYFSGPPPPESAASVLENRTQRNLPGIDSSPIYKGSAQRFPCQNKS